MAGNYNILDYISNTNFIKQPVSNEAINNAT